MELPHELLVNEILPALDPEGIYHFSLTSSAYVSLFYDEKLWQIKCQRDLPEKGINLSEGSWREHYLGELIPKYRRGNRLSSCYYNHQLQTIFPPCVALIILVDSATPLLRVEPRQCKAERIFAGDLHVPLDRIDRAVIVLRDQWPVQTEPMICKSELLPKGPHRQIFWSYEEYLYEELTHLHGDPPIYGYWYRYLSTGGWTKRFKIIDNRGRRRKPKFLDEYETTKPDFTEKELRKLGLPEADSKEKLGWLLLIDLLRTLKGYSALGTVVFDAWSGFPTEDIIDEIVKEIRRYKHILSDVMQR